MFSQMTLSLSDSRACQVGQNVAHVRVGCVSERFAFGCFRNRAALTVDLDPEPSVLTLSKTLRDLANLAVVESFFHRTDCPVWHGSISTKERIVMAVFYQESSFLIAP